MLQQVDAALWLVDGPIVSFFGFPYPTRSVIARLDDGGLWVWSPVALGPALAAEVEALGPVRHLVSPNKLHHLFLAEWQRAYPGALLWGPASTIRRHRGLRFQPPLTGEPPAAWRGQIDQAWFRGSFAMDEIAFLHRASRTVIVADLIEAFDDAFLETHCGPCTRLLARLGGIRAEDPKAPIDWRLSFVRRDLARAARAVVLGWDCERVVMAHGVWQGRGGHAYLERALRWMGPAA